MLPGNAVASPAVLHLHLLWYWFRASKLQHRQ